MKQWRWRKVGMKLELAVVSWLKEFGAEQVTWDTVGKIDVYDGFCEIECKRLRRTEYVTVSWLWKNVVSRYSKGCPLKILVVTKDCWDALGDALLKAHGIKTIVVGSIDRKRELERAKRIFMNAFLECLVEAAERCQKVSGV